MRTLKKAFGGLHSIDIGKEQQKIQGKIAEVFGTCGKHKVTKVEHKNIMLIGRTRTGKSTIKNLLVDPQRIPDQPTLWAATKTASFQSFAVDDNNTVLNIIDTPGLFERGSETMDIQDNETLLNTIKQCADREITKFHIICFVASFEAGINEQDIQSLKLLIKFLNPLISKNSCLIVTRCESKTERQLNVLGNELETDRHFKELVPNFEKGIHFSGSLNFDDWSNANESSLYRQFITVCKYRDNLIDLFTSDIIPFDINQCDFSAFKQIAEEKQVLSKEIEDLKKKSQDAEQAWVKEIGDLKKKYQDAEQAWVKEIGDLKKKSQDAEQTRLKIANTLKLYHRLYVGETENFDIRLEQHQKC
ncbi:unnamed protein product, partial [Didymodactylos carnosus]